MGSVPLTEAPVDIDRITNYLLDAESNTNIATHDLLNVPYTK